MAFGIADVADRHLHPLHPVQNPLPVARFSNQPTLSSILAAVAVI
jgi:hypothetical protein